MKKRVKLAFWVIAFGWFPLIFLTGVATQWNRHAQLALVAIAFITCAVGLVLLLSAPIDHIFKSAETLNKEIKNAMEASLSSHRWTEAIKRESIKALGITLKNIEANYDRLVKKNWKP